MFKNHDLLSMSVFFWGLMMSSKEAKNIGYRPIMVVAVIVEIKREGK